ncbi:MAG: right-handed parallel beta-helix repeat-containing protein [Methanomassiliicoccales archaeon]|nr:MAG: right-handed parallel beta-helix repeat-containing protein [Methanomassiliicoccales archaeon]
MRDRFTSIGMVIIIVTAGLLGFITFESDMVSAGTIYVGGSGLGNESSIQAAIDLAIEGDTVFVYDNSAPYYEDISVYKTINLVGENRDTTIIEGTWSTDVVNITADRVNVTGFTVKGSGGFPGDSAIELYDVVGCRVFNNTALSNVGYGIHLSSSKNNMIRANHILSNSQIGIRLLLSSNNNVTANEVISTYFNGIELLSSSKNNITGNTISNNVCGIYLSSSSDNNITDNNVSSNEWDGIYLSSSSNNTIYSNDVSENEQNGLFLASSQDNEVFGNNFTNDGLFIGGNQLSHFNSHVIPPDNLVNGNPLIYQKDLSGLYFDGAEIGQLILANCTNNVITNLQIENTDAAMELAYCMDTDILENDALGNRYGIYLYASSEINITNNEISDNDEGICLYSSSNKNNITWNTVLSNGLGIRVESSSNNDITDNTLTSNAVGITVSASYNNITNNTVSNSGHGIRLYGSNSNITDNNASNNQVGIFLGSSSNNNILKNNASNCQSGIIISDTSSINDVIRNNVSWNYWHGIRISDSTNNVIIGNNASNNYAGIYIDESIGNDVSGNNASFNDYGIYIYWYSTGNDILNNKLSSNNYYGVYCYQSSSNTILGNSVSNNWCGIYLDQSPDNTVSTNSLLGNAFYAIYSDPQEVNAQSNYWGTTDLERIERMVWNADYSSPLSSEPTGMQLQYITGSVGWSGTVIVDKGTLIEGDLTATNANIVFDNPKGENFLQVHGEMNVESSEFNSNFGNYTILYTNKSQGWIKDSNITWQRSITTQGDNILISNDNISSGYVGILSMSYASDNIISNNSIKLNNWYGIRLIRSNGNSIDDNLVFPNYGNGIFLEDSNGNNITDNTISENNNGIYIDGSSLNNITKNNVSNNNEGISLYFSSNDNTILENTVSYNIGDGIHLKSSWSNKIIGNDVISNGGYGIYIATSIKNRIYHNNIINNGIQAFDDMTDLFNFWNDTYPSGGNYWSDFDEASEDAYDDYSGSNQYMPGSDGIVDKGPPVGGKNPYIIDSDSQDEYPLMYSIGNYTFLYEGWNLISIPFIQSDTNVGSVLSSITGAYTAVQWFDPTDMDDPWKHNCTLKPQYMNDLDDINHTMGFWIYINKPGGVLFEYFGVQPIQNQSISIYPGWNLVGYPSLGSKNRTKALNNISFPDDVDYIFAFDGATKTWDEIGPLDFFEVGKGYWFHAKTECVWEVPL